MQCARRAGQDGGLGADGGVRPSGAANLRPLQAGQTRVCRHLAVHLLPQAAANAQGRTTGEDNMGGGGLTMGDGLLLPKVR